MWLQVGGSKLYLKENWRACVKADLSLSHCCFNIASILIQFFNVYVTNSTAA